MSMTSNSIDATREYKDICAGIGCRNRPSVSLRIIIVDKKGRFCKSCGDDFIRLGLAQPLLDGSCCGGGSHAHHDDETNDDCHSAGSWIGLGLQARCSCACHHHNVTAATDSAHEKEVPETQ
jgi:hypothetical protein